jgi:hypothetical protein
MVTGFPLRSVSVTRESPRNASRWEIFVFLASRRCTPAELSPSPYDRRNSESDGSDAGITCT